MKYMKMILTITLALSTSTAFANRESGGIGSPKLYYSCVNLAENFERDFGGGAGFQVDIGKVWPKYDLQISILNRIKRSLDQETVDEMLPSNPGEALTFVGKKYQLSIFTTSTPILENGRVFFYSELTVDGRKSRKLKCESLRN